ncbi:glutamate/aspartate ABC transporter substrate-binding protein [Paralcaligenes sp. KSB-10]|uniref:glutamate/aspartate ABC transporter substrate-binding protein n=1 Tax=Paralcaligenes sp. KSB-10 TaxID=2901142 RepID=UPI001E311C9B|nr:glutamate/aspartate ABC transporter substrate-binding protein [Paralcaligenes sp. KSB-10]UHL65337.1 glutamate/aspartate ABC transporter substrate-binding protein [Paralcaligenes sp. KSB-10]
MKRKYNLFYKSILLSQCAAAVALALGAGSALADDALSGTLKKIKDEGVVVVGYRDASIPFSYYDADQKPIGYSMDFTNLIVAELKKKLNLPNLKVRQIPITSQNRISLLQNGTFDFECTTTTHNESRAKQVDFSNSIFEIGTRLLVNKNSNIKDFADLNGKTLVVGAGTTSEKIIRSMNVEKKLGMSIISAKDHSESFLMLSTGRAKAMMMDDALLAGERAKTKNPSDYIITGTPQSYEVYGCMVRKNDEGLKSLMNEVIAKAETSGEGEKIYNKWFMSPIPPKGLNLDFPLSDAMKKLFAHPNDKPVS